MVLYLEVHIPEMEGLVDRIHAQRPKDAKIAIRMEICRIVPSDCRSMESEKSRVNAKKYLA